MSRSIPTLAIPPGTPPGICTEKIPGPRAFDSQFFPGPGAFDNPRDISNVYSIYCIGAKEKVNEYCIEFDKCQIFKSRKHCHQTDINRKHHYIAWNHFERSEISAFLVSNFASKYGLRTLT